MKRLDFLKKLPTPVRMFAHPMLFISLVLHALLLMMPISSNLEKFESAEKEETVKITKLPSAAKSSSGSSPQPSPKPTPQLTPQPSSITRLNQASSPQLIITPQQSDTSPVAVPKSSPQTQPNLQPQQQSKEDITSQQSTEEPTQTPSTEEPTQPKSTEEPTQTPSTNNQDPTNKGIGGNYGDFYHQDENQIVFNAVLLQVEREFDLAKFDHEKDINILNEFNKFKDEKGNPDPRFNFIKKALSPLTPDQLYSAFKTEFSNVEFEFDKVGTYGGGSVYEARKGDFKRYIILAPGEEQRRNTKRSLTAIILSEQNPQTF